MFRWGITFYRHCWTPYSGTTTETCPRQGSLRFSVLSRPLLTSWRWVGQGTGGGGGGGGRVGEGRGDTQIERKILLSLMALSSSCSLKLLRISLQSWKHYLNALLRWSTRTCRNFRSTGLISFACYNPSLLTVSQVKKDNFVFYTESTNYFLLLISCRF